MTDICPSPETATKRAQAARGSLLHVPYGDRERERLDIYFPEDESEGEWGAQWPRGRALPAPGRSPASSVSCSFALLCVFPRRVLAEWKVSRGSGMT